MAGGAGGRLELGEAAWQVACLLSVVFDAGADRDPHGASAVERRQAWSGGGGDAVGGTATRGGQERRGGGGGEAGGEAGGGAGGGELGPSYQAAAAMVMWRSCAALSRACTDAPIPGGWGEALPSEPPLALSLALEWLGASEHVTVAEGEHEGMAAARLSAAAAVVYEAEWAHLELSVAVATADETKDRDGLRRRLKQRVKLLAAWAHPTRSSRSSRRTGGRRRGRRRGGVRSSRRARAVTAASAVTGRCSAPTPR